MSAMLAAPSHNSLRRARGHGCSARSPRLGVAAVVAAVAAAVAGCSSAPSGTMVLSWRFADGRDCFTAGATTVEARTSAARDATPLGTFRCFDGAAPATVSVDTVPGSGTLYLDAVTPLGADLYHGELSLEASPPGTGETRTVTLYAVAAQ